MPIYRKGKRRTDAQVGLLEERLTLAEMQLGEIDPVIQSVEAMKAAVDLNSERLTGAEITIHELASTRGVIEESLELLTLDLEGLRTSSIVREIAQQDPERPMEYTTEHPFSELVDVETLGPRSVIAISIFPQYDVVGLNRFRLRGDVPAPGTVIYATYQRV